MADYDPGAALSADHDSRGRQCDLARGHGQYPVRGHASRGTRLLVALGHGGCGAVQAALSAKFQGAQKSSRIALPQQVMLPGLAEVDAQLSPQRQLEIAVEANVRWSIQSLRQTLEGRAASAEGRMRLVAAVCDLATGHLRLRA